MLDVIKKQNNKNDVQEEPSQKLKNRLRKF